MWKDSLCTGVEIIDTQHKELFKKTEELMKAVNSTGADSKEKCISTVLFLKDYAVRHFKDEEAYQQSISYPDFPAHKKLHEKFIGTVLSHEKKMVESDFSDKDVKEFIGMLVAWLLYHVADSDQKVGKAAAAGADVVAAAPAVRTQSHSEIVANSICDVLNKMAGLNRQSMARVKELADDPEGEITIEMTLEGDVSGYIALAYPIPFIKNLILEMMNFTPDDIYELEMSALFETSGIIVDTICQHIAKEKSIVCHASPPFVTERLDIHPDERIALDTGIGFMEADIVINYN